MYWIETETIVKRIQADQTKFLRVLKDEEELKDLYLRYVEFTNIFILYVSVVFCSEITVMKEENVRQNQKELVERVLNGRLFK